MLIVVIGVVPVPLRSLPWLASVVVDAGGVVGERWPVVMVTGHGVTLSNGVVLVGVVFRRRLLTVGVVALAMWCLLTVTEWLCYSSGRVVSLSWLLVAGSVAGTVRRVASVVGGV
jgi:hypothetical protein